MTIPCAYMYHQLKKDLRGGFVCVYNRLVKIGITKIR